MSEINDLKAQIFDIIRQQEMLSAKSNQLEQVKRTLVTQLGILEKMQSEKDKEEGVQDAEDNTAGEEV